MSACTERVPAFPFYQVHSNIFPLAFDIFIDYTEGALLIMHLLYQDVVCLFNNCIFPVCLAINFGAVFDDVVYLLARVLDLD